MRSAPCFRRTGAARYRCGGGIVNSQYPGNVAEHRHARLEHGTTERWALKLIIDNFRPGDQVVETSSDSGSVTAKAFVSPRGERKLLVINKRERAFSVDLPEPGATKLQIIDLETGSNPPASTSIAGKSFNLGAFGIAVVTLAR